MFPNGKRAVCNVLDSHQLNVSRRQCGLAQALPKLSVERKGKEVNLMKIATSFLAALLLVSSLGASNAFAAAPGVISNAVLTPGSYCHLTFPAIREETLSWDDPVLKDPGEGDIIDFYGSCDHDPLGQDEIARQRRQAAGQYESDE
jgi:hypothetical protein